MIKQVKTILIVEDEQYIRQILADRFSYEGFSVLEAEDGVQGLEVALEECPDLILLDIVMPKMDGITMMKKLRRHKAGKDIPIILLTNLSANDGGTKKYKPAFYLIKSDWKIKDVIKKAKEKLKLKT